MIYKIDELRHVVIGREIDGGITALRVDCSAWLERYPQLTQYRIEVTSPAGIVYIAETEFVDGILTWNITQADTSQPGDGQYQIVATGADGERKTSSHPRLTILDIMKGTAGDAPPAPSASWVDQVVDNAESAKTAAQNAEDAADRAEDAAVNPPIIGDNGHWLLWDFETGRYIDSGVAAQGPPGQAYTLPPATPDTLGGMMIGEGLVADEDGRVNVVEDGCELIDELTLQEAVSEFSLNVTPDGKPYNFCRMIIVVNKPAVQTSGYMWLTVNNMDKSEPMNRLAVVSTHDENERNAWCDMSIVAGRVRSVFADASVKAASIVYVGTTQSAFMNVKATSINAIRYSFGNFPAGTKIMIYGEWRRDNE